MRCFGSDGSWLSAATEAEEFDILEVFCCRPHRKEGATLSTQLCIFMFIYIFPREDQTREKEEDKS